MEVSGKKYLAATYASKKVSFASCDPFHNSEIIFKLPLQLGFNVGFLHKYESAFLLARQSVLQLLGTAQIQVLGFLATHDAYSYCCERPANIGTQAFNKNRRSWSMGRFPSRHSHKKYKTHSATEMFDNIDPKTNSLRTKAAEKTA